MYTFRVLALPAASRARHKCITIRITFSLVGPFLTFPFCLIDSQYVSLCACYSLSALLISHRIEKYLTYALCCSWVSLVFGLEMRLHRKHLLRLKYHR